MIVNIGLCVFDVLGVNDVGGVVIVGLVYYLMMVEVD